MASRPRGSKADVYKQDIIEMFNEGYDYPEIGARFSLSRSTVCRRLEKQGIRRRAPLVKKEDTILRLWVAIYFQSNLSDKVICLALQQEGWCVHEQTIARIWKSQGLVQQMSAFQQEETNKQLWDVIEKELDSSTIEGYGKGLLYTYFKKLGYQVLQ